MSNQSGPAIRRVVVSNIVYFVGALRAEDLNPGEAPWDTGLCESESIASQRLELYRLGEQVSEAPPQQCSRRQLEAYVRTYRYTGAPFAVDRALAALEAGLSSPDWALCSVLFIAHLYEIDGRVVSAGGTRIRRGKTGPVPVDAAGQASLTRG